MKKPFTERFAGFLSLLIIGMLLLGMLMCAPKVLDSFNAVQDIKIEGYKTNG